MEDQCLDITEVITPDREKYNLARLTIENRDDTRIIYKRNISTRKIIGSCIEFANKLKPTSYIDFFNKWVEYATFQRQYKPIKECGCCYDDVLSIAKRFQKECLEVTKRTDIPFEDYLHLVLGHIYIETYDGYMSEEYVSMYVKKYMSDTLKECIKTSSDVDTKYSLDLIVELKDGRKFGVQIKPKSFYIGSRQDIANDQAKQYINYFKAKEDLNLFDVYYVLYDMDTSTGDIVYYYKYERKDGTPIICNKLTDVYRGQPEPYLEDGKWNFKPSGKKPSNKTVNIKKLFENGEVTENRNN